jgi:hypothetical protein
MTKTYLDTETCGLHSIAVLLQYARDDGPILLHEFWRSPIQETLELIEQIAQTDVVGFNLVFDWFHLCKIYTLFSLCDPTWIPEDHIEEIALLEPQARFGPCLKPVRALDLMLIAKRGRYQSLMDRKDIKIRKVPEAIAYKLAEHLEDTVELDDIYFSRRKDKYAPRWTVRPNKDMPGFKDVILKFAASGALKVLAQHALKVPREEILKYADIEVDKKYRPKEFGWAPFALAAGKPGKWNWAWPEVIQFHIDHWAFNSRARQYASSDVDYTRRLDAFFDSPEPGDVDSVLACQIAAVRWRSFKMDQEKVEAQRQIIREKIKDTPIAPKVARIWITEPMEEVEKMQVKNTKRTVLEELSLMPCDCTFDSEIKDCPICGGSKLHPSAVRARTVLEARQGKYRDKIYQKLKQAGYRFHASFKVTGALSNRMSGADGLNAQGFERLKATRACFTFADEGFELGGGDFDSFEPVIADAMYDDPELRKVLSEKFPCDCNKKTGSYNPDCDDCHGSGVTTKKLHALFGMELSGLDYAGVMATKGNGIRDWYATGKAGVLAKIYGGDWSTLVRKQRIEEEVAKAADAEFERKYQGIGANRRLIIEMFCSMRQPEEGGKVYWHEPADKIESLLGFPRYFILENSICRSLYNLAQNVPQDWKTIKGKVVRNEAKGRQTAAGAAMSALFGAAFGIQGAAMRAAANHRIQSTGAEITKKLQFNIWEIQPAGVHPWRVIPMNAHDEVLVPSLPEYTKEVKRIADATVESYLPLIPLLKMHWKTKMVSWAEK